MADKFLAIEKMKFDELPISIDDRKRYIFQK